MLERVYVELEIEVLELAKECFHTPEANTLRDVTAHRAIFDCNRKDLNSIVELIEEGKSENVYRVLYYIMRLKEAVRYNLYSMEPELIDCSVYDVNEDTARAVDIYNKAVDVYNTTKFHDHIRLEEIDCCISLVVDQIISNQEAVGLHGKMYKLAARDVSCNWIDRLRDLVTMDIYRYQGASSEVLVLTRMLLIYYLGGLI